MGTKVERPVIDISNNEWRGPTDAGFYIKPDAEETKAT